MRRLLIVTAGIVLIAAVHTSIPSKAAPLVAPVSDSNWTGFYVGGHFGGGWGSQSATGTATTFDDPPFFSPTPLVASSSSTMRVQGIFGGGQVGYNYQLPSNWLLGIEADIDVSNIQGSTNSCFTTLSDRPGGLPPGSISGCGASNAKLDYFGTVRGRVGYVWNNLLLYGTGGWAWGHGTSSASPLCGATNVAPCPGVGGGPITGDTFSFSKTFSGWAVGAGTEWKFLPNWALRLEYLHLQFPVIETSGSSRGSQGPASFTDNLSSRANVGIDMVRVGLNYMFNWTPPQVAR